MKTHIQTFAIVTFLFVNLFAGTTDNCKAQTYTFVDDYEDTYSVPTLTLDDSHDLVRLMKDGDEIEIEIFMFDANVFDSIPDTLDFDLLEDLASEYDKFDLDLDDLDGLYIYLEGGDDIVYTDQALELNLGILGGDGNDFIQGGSGNDALAGCNGSDKIFGFGGWDSISGGGFLANYGLVDDLQDFERDYLWGGAGHDTFVQTPILVTYGYLVTDLGTRGGSTPTATRKFMLVSLDKIMDFQSWEDEVQNVFN